MIESRSGTTLIYQGLPGESIKLMKDGRFIIAHPDRMVKVGTTDGKVETLTRDNHPDIWAQFENVVNQLLRPN